MSDGSRILYIATALGENDWEYFLPEKFAMLRKEWGSVLEEAPFGSTTNENENVGGFCMIGVTPNTTYYGTETEPFEPVQPTLSDAQWQCGTKVFRTSPTPEILSKPPGWMMDVVLVRKLIAKSYVPGKTHLVVGTHSLGDCFDLADVLVENDETPDPQHYNVVAPPRFKYQVKERYQYPSEEFFHDLFSGTAAAPSGGSGSPTYPKFLTATLDSCFMGELHTISAVWRQLQTPFLMAPQGWMWTDDRETKRSLFGPVAAKTLWSITDTSTYAPVSEELKDILRRFTKGPDNSADAGLYDTKVANELHATLASKHCNKQSSGDELDNDNQLTPQERTWKEWQKVAHQRFYCFIREEAKRLGFPKWAEFAEQQLRLFDCGGGCSGDFMTCKCCADFDFSTTHDLNPQFNFYANTDDTGFHAGWLVEGESALSYLFDYKSKGTPENNDWSTLVNQLAAKTVLFHIGPNK